MWHFLFIVYICQGLERTNVFRHHNHEPLISSVESNYEEIDRRVCFSRYESIPLGP